MNIAPVPEPAVYIRPVRERAVAFDSRRARLQGIVSRPPQPEAECDIAALIVVGGPQYRVGSHRQFVSLARALARAGYPTLRFDLAGMGDSEGDLQTFESAGPDIHNAIDALLQSCPLVSRVVVWGLCDGASAALMFATGHPRVVGVIAANPWVRSDASLATARLKYYYTSRLLEPEFWLKLLGGGLRWRESLRGLLSNLRGARQPTDPRGDDRGQPFQTVMAHGVERFGGPLLVILSGNDITAKEFIEFVRSSPPWQGLLERPGVTRVDMPDADHTFSRRDWRLRVEAESIALLDRLRGACADDAARAPLQRRNP